MQGGGFMPKLSKLPISGLSFPRRFGVLLILCSPGVVVCQGDGIEDPSALLAESDTAKEGEKKGVFKILSLTK